jgi:hypothetical protein
MRKRHEFEAEEVLMSPSASSADEYGRPQDRGQRSSSAPRLATVQEQPRLAALTDAEIKAQRSNRSWIPAAARDAALDPAHWSRRVRQEKYWRMVEIWNAHRLVH